MSKNGLKTSASKASDTSPSGYVLEGGGRVPVINETSFASLAGEPLEVPAELPPYDPTPPVGAPSELPPDPLAVEEAPRKDAEDEEAPSAQEEETVWVEALATRPLRPGPGDALLTVSRGRRWQQPEALALRQVGAGLVKLVEGPAS